MQAVVFECEAGILWWREEGFWHYRMNAHYEMSAAEMSACFDAVEQFGSNKKAPLLIDRSNPYSPSFGVWEMFRKRAPAHITAIAYYAPTPNAVMASQFVRDVLFKEWKDVAIFRTEEDAVAWLQKFVEQAQRGTLGEEARELP